MAKREYFSPEVHANSLEDAIDQSTTPGLPVYDKNEGVFSHVTNQLFDTSSKHSNAIRFARRQR
jgi:hypothetical protein